MEHVKGLLNHIVDPGPHQPDIGFSGKLSHVLNNFVCPVHIDVDFRHQLMENLFLDGFPLMYLFQAETGRRI